MMEGIIDLYKVIDSMVYKSGYMPDVDDEGNLIQSRDLASQYKKKLKKRIKDGEILRFSMHNQISVLDCYKPFDEIVNNNRREIVDKLNEKYYGKEKYHKMKQCME